MEDNITCPYCQTEYFEIEDLYEMDIDEGYNEVECPNCGMEFVVGVTVEVSYESLKKECYEDNHNWGMVNIYDGRTHYRQCKDCGIVKFYG